MNTNEALITIGGKELTLAQSMTVRVAIQSFAISIQEDGLGDDQIGRDIATGYLKAIREINELLKASIEFSNKRTAGGL